MYVSNSNYKTIQSNRKELKRKPIVIIISFKYNFTTKYCNVCPFTNGTHRNNPAYYTLNDYETDGQVITLQVRTLDYSDRGKRKIQYIETLEKEDFLQIYQRVQLTLELND